MSVVDRVRMKCVECGDCLLWQGAENGRGVPQMRGLNGGGQSARRVVWEAAKGRGIPAGGLISVTCGQSMCLNPDHLELTSRSKVSVKSNARASVKAKRSASAARTNQAKQGKLDMQKASYIRASDKTGRALASELGVSPQLISHVRCGYSWKEYGSNPFLGLMA